MPYLSFVLLCYNHWDITSQAITSLIESMDQTLYPKGIELIVVDNGSTDETPDRIQAIKNEHENQTFKIHYVRLEENMGFTIGINTGLSKCNGELIGILNNDLIFPNGWLHNLIAVLDHDETVGIVAPYLTHASGAQGIDVELETREEIEKFAEEFMENNKNQIIYTYRVIGACLLLKRDVLHLIGGNDFWFGEGQFDDDDLCIRIALAGYKIAIVGGSFVYHLGSVTYLPNIWSTFYANEGKFTTKWNLATTSIQEIIEHSLYSIEKHFFPNKIDDFVPVPDHSLRKGGNHRELLLVADWNNDRSMWRQKLESVLKDLKSNEEIHLWIPRMYFLSDPIYSKIQEEFTKVLEPLGNSSILQVIDSDIPPLHLLSFIKTFDAVLSVGDDYVNKYIVFLGKQIQIPIR